MILLLGLTLLLIFGLAKKHASGPDLVFALCIALIVAPQIVSLETWPEFVAYIGGDFRVVSVSATTAERLGHLLAAFTVGWLLVALPSAALVPHRRALSFGAPCAPVWRVVHGWFLVSLLTLAFLARQHGVGVAGLTSELPYLGVIYYLFPVDHLAVMLAAAYGYGIFCDRRMLPVLVILFAAYVVFKVATGWKAPIIFVAIAYAVGYFVAGKRANPRKAMLLAGIIGVAYIGVVKPLVSYVRTGSATPSEEQMLGRGEPGLNPLAGRLTEGTLNAAAAIDADLFDAARVHRGALVVDLVDRLVPGHQFDAPSIDRVFTEDVLGQPEGVASTFAPGALGMAELLGGVAGAVGYGACARLVILMLSLVMFATTNAALKFYYLGMLPIATISICLDGLTGGLEKVIILGPIILIVTGVGRRLFVPRTHGNGEGSS